MNKTEKVIVFVVMGTLVIASVLFKPKLPTRINPSITPVSIPKRMLFVGDIMMARGVAQLTEKYGLEYPFFNIRPLFYLFNWNIIYGNLEGPVRTEAKPVSLFSVRFDYSPEIPQLLAKLGFNLLNIANNHMADQGYSAIDSTRKYLEENHIFPLGDYSDCSLKYKYQKDNFIFLGANLVYKSKYCVQDLLQEIKELKTKDTNLYVIVTPHWGTEYTSSPDDFQKQTAHQLIEAGADLIIGHHPHVVQAIEEYQGKLIFYSLGNFVFDMYFFVVSRVIISTLCLNKVIFIYPACKFSSFLLHSMYLPFVCNYESAIAKISIFYVYCPVSQSVFCLNVTAFFTSNICDI